MFGRRKAHNTRHKSFLFIAQGTIPGDEVIWHIVETGSCNQRGPEPRWCTTNHLTNRRHFETFPDFYLGLAKTQETKPSNIYPPDILGISYIQEMTYRYLKISCASWEGGAKNDEQLSPS
jgi:hypothetical protein